jgi:uncharacterized protein YbaR (Trm112 family)
MLRTDQLKSLRCPVSGGRLEWMDADCLRRYQQAVAASAVVNRRGELVLGVPEAALVCADSGLVYACRDNIPVLIADEAVTLGQLEDW